MGAGGSVEERTNQWATDAKETSEKELALRKEEAARTGQALRTGQTKAWLRGRSHSETADALSPSARKEKAELLKELALLAPEATEWVDSFRFRVSKALWAVTNIGAVKAEAWEGAIAVRKLSKAVEKLQEALDRALPPDVGQPDEGGADLSNGWTEDELKALGAKDCGQPDFFGEIRAGGGKPVDIAEACEAALPAPDEAFFVCDLCNNPTQNRKAHTRNCREGKAQGKEPTFSGMTAEYIVKRIKNPDDCPFIRVYTDESPMCYTGNWAGRTVAFRGLDPKKDEHWLRYAKYEYGLQKELLGLEALQCLCYRALNFKFQWAEGFVKTWPQISSAARNPRVVRAFLGGGPGKPPYGSIAIIHGQTPRSIAKFSLYPYEEEVVFFVNTQFKKRAVPGSGVKQLMATALRVSLEDVDLLEIDEVRLEVWDDVLIALTKTEKLVNNDVVQIIEGDVESKSMVAMDRISGETVSGRPMGDLLGFIAHRALEVPNNIAVLKILLHRCSLPDAMRVEDCDHHRGMWGRGWTLPNMSVRLALQKGDYEPLKWFMSEGADFSGAQIMNVSMSAGQDFSVDMDGRKCWMDLTNVVFMNTDLTAGIELGDTKLTSPWFNCTMLPDNFDLSNRNLGKVTFSSCDMTKGVKLQGCTFKGPLHPYLKARKAQWAGQMAGAAGKSIQREVEKALSAMPAEAAEEAKEMYQQQLGMVPDAAQAEVVPAEAAEEAKEWYEQQSYQKWCEQRGVKSAANGYDPESQQTEYDWGFPSSELPPDFDLRGLNIEGCSFAACDLSKGLQLDGTNIRHCNFHRVTPPKEWDLRNCDLTGCNFYYVDFKSSGGVRLEGANVKNAYFKYAIFPDDMDVEGLVERGALGIEVTAAVKAKQQVAKAKAKGGYGCKAEASYPKDSKPVVTFKVPEGGGNYIYVAEAGTRADAYVTYESTPETAEGSVTIGGISSCKVGKEYEFRYFLYAASAVLGDVAKFTVTDDAAGRIASLAPGSGYGCKAESSYPKNSKPEVTFKVPEGGGNYIYVAEAGSAENSYITYNSSGKDAEGSVTISEMRKLTVGKEYEFRYYDYSTKQIVGDVAKFTVVEEAAEQAPAQKLHVAAGEYGCKAETSYSVGSTPEVAFKVPEGGGNYLYVAEVGSGPSKYVTYESTGSAAEGSVKITSMKSLTAGKEYEFRYINYSSGEIVGNVAKFTVTEDPAKQALKQKLAAGGYGCKAETSYSVGSTPEVAFKVPEGVTSGYMYVAEAGSAPGSYATYESTGSGQEGTVKITCMSSLTVGKEYEFRYIDYRGDGSVVGSAAKFTATA